MECLYIPEMTHGDSTCSVHGDELKHMRSLRLRNGDSIAVSNGQGVVVACSVAVLTKEQAELHIEKVLVHERAAQRSVNLVVGVLDDRSRMEFVIEKAVECGASEIIPVVSQHVQRPKFNVDRAQRKIVAALKQSHQPWLCKISEPVSDLDSALADAEGVCIGFDASANENFDRGSVDALSDVTLFIGPEGGWSDHELLLLRQKAKMYVLGQRRLRAETAAIVALGKLL